MNWISEPHQCIELMEALLRISLLGPRPESLRTNNLKQSWTRISTLVLTKKTLLICILVDISCIIFLILNNCFEKQQILIFNIFFRSNFMYSAKIMFINSLAWRSKLLSSSCFFLVFDCVCHGKKLVQLAMECPREVSNHISFQKYLQISGLSMADGMVNERF